MYPPPPSDHIAYRPILFTYASAAQVSALKARIEALTAERGQTLNTAEVRSQSFSRNAEARALDAFECARAYTYRSDGICTEVRACELGSFEGIRLEFSQLAGRKCAPFHKASSLSARAL